MIFYGYMNASRTFSKKIIPEIGFTYIKIVLVISLSVLLLYSYLNFFILNRLIIGYSCLITGLLVGIDLVYALITKKLLYNLFISIIAFSILCLLTPIFRGEHTTIGRMWILLLPGICFYTQPIKRSLSVLISMFVLLFLLKFIFFRSLSTVDNILNLEQLIVLFLISCMTLLYARSEEKKNIELERQHFSNLLTGLPNRKQLIKDLEFDKYKILTIINVNSFNNINSIYGNDVGDEVLLELSRRLKKFVLHKDGYQLYKLHADEYAICIFNNRDIDEEINAIKDLTPLLNKMITIGVFEIYPSTSIGVSYGYNNIIEKADLALKTAKQDRESIVIYDRNHGMKDKFRKDLLSIYKLNNAIKTDGIKPFFQPIINIKTGRVEKYESLVRIIHDDEIISPIQFLSLSKKIKVYNKITMTMIDKTFDHFSNNIGSFSINLDSDDLMNDEITAYIYNKIVEYKNGHRIIFEILESQEIDDLIKVMLFVDSIKDLGCKIAIDDFGSGYSNFDYISMFKVDFLKIDSSLIKNIDIDKKSYLMTKSIVTFAKQLGIKTIAEHIDKSSILRIVESLGIDYGQGFYWSKPLPLTKNNLSHSLL